MIFNRLKSFALLAAVPWIAGSLLACSGMAELTGAPGGGNFAEQKDGSGRGVEEESSAANSGNPAFRPGDEGQPTGLNKIAGPEGGDSGPVAITSGTGSASTYAAAGNTIGGYRPGSEGQVQMGPNIFVGVAGLDGRTNCNKPSDVPYDVLFPGGSGPTLYYWLSQEETGGYIPTGFMKPMNEYGRIAIYCQNVADGTNYKYALLQASYTDAQGKTYRSAATHITCPDIMKGEAGTFCLTMEASAPTLKAYHPELLLENSGSSFLLNHPSLLNGD